MNINSAGCVGISIVGMVLIVLIIGIITSTFEFLKDMVIDIIDVTTKNPLGYSYIDRLNAKREYKDNVKRWGKYNWIAQSYYKRWQEMIDKPVSSGDK
jgi:hypothetical protein